MQLNVGRERESGAEIAEIADIGIHSNKDKYFEEIIDVREKLRSRVDEDKGIHSRLFGSKIQRSQRYEARDLNERRDIITDRVLREETKTTVIPPIFAADHLKFAADRLDFAADRLDFAADHPTLPLTTRLCRWPL